MDMSILQIPPTFGNHKTTSWSKKVTDYIFRKSSSILRRIPRNVSINSVDGFSDMKTLKSIRKDFKTPLSFFSIVDSGIFINLLFDFHDQNCRINVYHADRHVSETGVHRFYIQAESP